MTSEGSFSGALQLTGLNDYLAPTQACVKPLQSTNSKKKAQKVTIDVDIEGRYFEEHEDGTKEELKRAKITLNDCLACSGCVTSAETVLINQQNGEDFLRQLRDNQQLDAAQRRTVVVSIAPQVRASIAAYYKLPLKQAYQKLVTLFKSIGVDYVFDVSFSRDFSLQETLFEFLRKLSRSKPELIEQCAQRRSTSSSSHSDRSFEDQVFQRCCVDQTNEPVSSLPILTSACPGWVCYAEKTQGDFVLPFISSTKSPQQVMGSIVKDFFSSQTIHKPSNTIFHVSVMPCFDKKLEASRPDFFDEVSQTRDVDSVITSLEIVKLINDLNIDFLSLTESSIDPQFTNVDSDGRFFGTIGGSGGYSDYVLRWSAKILFGLEDVEIKSQQKARNKDFTDFWFEFEGKKVLSFAQAYGFKNIQNVVRLIKSKRCQYDFVEIMACPSGCLNGGGQSRPIEGESSKELLTRVEQSYRDVDGLCLPHLNSQANQLYDLWLDGKFSERSQTLLHTQYHAVEQMDLPIKLEW